MTRSIEHSRRYWPFDLRHLAVRARVARLDEARDADVPAGEAAPEPVAAAPSVAHQPGRMR